MSRHTHQSAPGERDHAETKIAGCDSRGNQKRGRLRSAQKDGLKIGRGGVQSCKCVPLCVDLANLSLQQVMPAHDQWYSTVSLSVHPTVKHGINEQRVTERYRTGLWVVKDSRGGMIFQASGTRRQHPKGVTLPAEDGGQSIAFLRHMGKMQGPTTIPFQAESDEGAPCPSDSCSHTQPAETDEASPSRHGL